MEHARRVHLEMGIPPQSWGSDLFGEGMVPPPGWWRRSLNSWPLVVGSRNKEKSEPCDQKLLTAAKSLLGPLVAGATLCTMRKKGLRSRRGGKDRWVWILEAISAYLAQLLSTVTPLSERVGTFRSALMSPPPGLRAIVAIPLTSTYVTNPTIRGGHCCLNSYLLKTFKQYEQT